VIAVDLRDNAGETLDRLVEAWPHKLLVLPDPNDASFPLLRAVDPYGDTYFARLQMPQLRA
jgi:hypothetical protein